jgi:putative ABC transport system substrate-binding protein
MQRRQFIILLSGAAASSVSWPLVARAQQAGVPVIGFLNSKSLADSTHLMPLFHQGLAEAGYVEGRNVTIEYRWANGDYSLLPAMAVDLVARKVAVIVATGGDVVALAAKAATTTIPIVFSSGSDPIKTGLVSSINRPDGNVTGISLFGGTLDAKRLEMLHEVVPQAAKIAVLQNPNLAEAGSRFKAIQAAAHAIGVQVFDVNAKDEPTIDAAFATITEQRADAIIVAGDPFLLSRYQQIVALAALHAVPAIYAWREYSIAGGLISYGVSLANATREAGLYAGKILKGATPSDLPVMQPTKFELVVNLKTAKTLGVTVPPTLLAVADEVIE